MADQHTEQPLNIKAVAWTAGVHIALLLLFIFVTYSTPAFDAPEQEMGMEVNLGTSDEGSGTDQPMAVDAPAPDAASAKYKASASAEESGDMLRTDEKDAPAIAPTNNSNNRNRTEADNRRRTNTQQTANNSNTTSRPQQPRYVYGGSTGRGGNNASTNAPGSSEGNTTGSGDRGVPGGTPGAPNYTGTPGSGNGGISHNLSGRSIVAFPPPEADFREGGRVVMRITVNRSGNIVNKQIVSSSNAELRAIALKKVDKIRFNKSDDAPEEQFGNITFVFKTRS